MKPNLYRRILPPPKFKDDYRGAVAKFLNVVLITIIALMSTLFVYRSALAGLFWNGTNQTIVSVIVFSSALLIAVRHGYDFHASVLLVFLTWLAVTFQVWNYDGIYDVGIAAYIIVIVISSVLTNWRIELAVTLLSIASIWGLATYHPNSIMLPTVDKPQNFARDLTIFFSLGGLIIFFLVRALHTSLKRMQKESEDRRRSEARLRSLVENTTDTILEVDRSGQILFINSYPDRYISQNVRDVLPPDQHQLAEETIAKVFQTGESQAVELQTIAPNGSVTWDSIRVGPIKTGDAVTSLTINMTEITEQKRIEQDRENLIVELEARNTELTQFAYTISHELKAPVVTMKGFIGSIGQDLKDRKYNRAEKDLQRVSTATDKMHETVSDLLQLSRVGRLMNDPEDIPFQEIVQDALERVHGSIEANNVTIHIQPNLPTVYGDRQRLAEVLQNMIDNAAKFMGGQPDPRIEIGQRGEEDDKPVFFVRDNGIGIDPEYHERIFGLFDKLDAKDKGTGIGLALVKRIVEFHGGRIWVESEAGRGATFYFTLESGEAKS